MGLAMLQSDADPVECLGILQILPTPPPGVEDSYQIESGPKRVQLMSSSSSLKQTPDTEAKASRPAFPLLPSYTLKGI